MIQEYQLRILPEIAANEQKLKEYLSKEKGLNLRDITATRILKRSIDARQRTIFVNLKVRAYIREMPKDDEYEHTIYNKVEGKPQVIVVGAGPGGLFAALRLIELGLRPVVIERGKDVRERKKDLAQISREHTVDPESNYSFGEGGAGAYSDGKLYTRSKKRGNIDKILNVFCQHGASTAILVDAHPHIGTDKLPRVIENMRNTIIECGGEVHFQTRMEALIIENDEVKGIETNTGPRKVFPVFVSMPLISLFSIINASILVRKCTSPPHSRIVFRIFSMTRGNLSVPICGCASASIAVEAPCWQNTLNILSTFPLFLLRV